MRRVTFAIFIALASITQFGCVGYIEHKSLELYGKVVDQHNQPVPNVDYKYRVGRMVPIPTIAQTTTTTSYEDQTDENGKFEITRKGLRLDVYEFKKGGFIFPRWSATYERLYDLPRGSKWPSTMSASAPVVIPAWKRGEAAELIKDGLIKYLSNRETGAIVPLKGTPVELAISWSAPGTRDNPADWSVTVKIKNGGLIETHDEFMFEAPFSGYQPEWRFDATTGIENVSRDFYITANGGAIYGRVAFRFKPYYNNSNEISLSYWINPHGSRNLLSEKGD